ncbi:MAG: carboxymuconolactone decarboxylase family protein [Clostridium sp.]|nr:carboxymuconolactone decarboxylase family protein [Clostridium sp.]
MENKYTEKQRKAREQFEADRGKWKWSDTWETILQLNPDILSAYSKMSSIPHKKGYLDQKTKEMLYVAIDGAITELYLPGLSSHLKHGLDIGVTKEEFLEVLAITSTTGAATYTMGIPVLVEELKAVGIDLKLQPLTRRQEQLKQRYIRENGYWNETLEHTVKLDEDMLEGYMDYVQASLTGGALDAKTREFIYIAANGAPTTLNREATAVHIRRALEAGATKEELIEVFESIACLGIHTVTVGVPALNQALNM